MRLPVLKLLIIFQLTRVVIGIQAIIFKYNRHRIVDEYKPIEKPTTMLPKVYNFPEQIENNWFEGEIPWEIKENSTESNRPVMSFNPLGGSSIAFLFI